MPIGHGFSFFGHGKSMMKKRGHPETGLYLLYLLSCVSFECVLCCFGPFFDCVTLFCVLSLGCYG